VAAAAQLLHGQAQAGLAGGIGRHGLAVGTAFQRRQAAACQTQHQAQEGEYRCKAHGTFKEQSVKVDGCNVTTLQH
jgi:hypothetical protein